MFANLKSLMLEESSSIVKLTERKMIKRHEYDQNRRPQDASTETHSWRFLTSELQE